MTYDNDDDNVHNDVDNHDVNNNDDDAEEIHSHLCQKCG